jgi:serpin B
MKSIRLFILTGAMILGGCGEKDLVNPPKDLTTNDLKTLKQGNRFGFDLYDQMLVQYPDSNLCISPYSVFTALSMAANGAGANTLAEMLDVLGFEGQQVTDLNTSIKHLNEVLIARDPATVFQTANSVWYNTDGFTVYKNFREVMDQYYGAPVEGLDFGDPATLGKINGWVKEQTKDKIEKIINRINRDDVCYLINALYFNGKWTTFFDRKQTQDGMFTSISAENQKVPFMYVRDTFRTIDDTGLKAVELPYGDRSWAMYVFLPPRGTVPADWCKNELFPKWEQLQEQFTENPQMEVYLPQFKMESSFELSDQLKAMGMPEAFTPQADFSNLGPGSLAISQVLHKTYIDVNEEGTEAAAVTAVIITRTSFPENEIRFNRPFVFVIAEKSTGSIIFLGQVTHF